MDVKYINPFLSAAIKVIKTMAQIDLNPEKPFLRRDETVYTAARAQVHFEGKTGKGMLIVGFEEKLLIAILFKMFGEKQTSIDENALDALGELTNMIGGQANAILEKSGLSVRQSTPKILHHKDYVSHEVPTNRVMIIPFVSPFGKIFVEFSLEQNSDAVKRIALQNKFLMQHIDGKLRAAFFAALKISHESINQEFSYIEKISAENVSSDIKNSLSIADGFSGKDLIDSSVHAFILEPNCVKVSEKLYMKNEETSAVMQFFLNLNFEIKDKIELREGSFEKSSSLSL